jgi:hypothetical protein
MRTFRQARALIRRDSTKDLATVFPIGKRRPRVAIAKVTHETRFEALLFETNNGSLSIQERVG